MDNIKVSFSQNYEDVILWRCLKDIQQGFFIDIGAFDPHFDSDTQMFVDQGWQGINVEPLPEQFKRFVKFRPNDINLNYGISLEAGPKKCFVHLKCPALSSFKEETGAIFKKEKNNFEEIVCNCTTLKEIWEVFKRTSNKNEIHFCKIDCEGSETDVIEQLIELEPKPWILLVETYDWRNKISFESNIANIIKHTHTLGYTNLLNSFYFRNDFYDQFKEKVVFQPTCLDGFLPFKEWHYKKMLFENEQKEQQHETTKESQIERINQQLRYENFLLQRQVQATQSSLRKLENKTKINNISIPFKINREIKRIINKILFRK
jgi:FkbM family methyltransferase